MGTVFLLPLAVLPALGVDPASGGLPVHVFVLLAVLVMVQAVALVLLLRGRWRRRSGLRKGQKNWILVDAANVMHWQDNTPQLEPVVRVVGALQAQGFDPGVVFDANAGWKLFGHYADERALGALLGLPQDQVMVVPKGLPTDPCLLLTAADLGARIVTNDRYKGMAHTHPQVQEPGFLVRGRLADGEVWLEGMSPAAGE
jgi:Zc3h12a-like Ribonuclease NYN domain